MTQIDYSLSNVSYHFVRGGVRICESNTPTENLTYDFRGLRVLEVLLRTCVKNFLR